MRYLKKIVIVFVMLFALLLSIYFFKVRLTPPQIPNDIPAPVITSNSNNYTSEKGWLKKKDYGLWEMYLEGSPYETGLTFGALADKSGLMAKKEKAFVNEIENRIPSSSYLSFLKYLVGWFNRDLDEYVPQEYLQEIYGSSEYMSDNYDYIAPKFHRALSYHAAHDIGHALQNMNMVGCTSFATWNNESTNNELLIGRNFDFYFGQPFAEDKIVAFYNPDNGYQFMSVTWACFSGVVSGINEKGLTVTLNSAKSEIPTKGKTPVSFIARKILQYASTIEEAYSIAKSYDSFVAETFLIGSKNDNKAGLIEKTPETTEMYYSNSDRIIVTNHFQSEGLVNDPINQEYVNEGVSDYRYDRVNQLLDSLIPISNNDASFILRNKQGMEGENIGLSNEKAINQLIAHHSVIFSPTNMIAWVSAPPYNLSNYIAYDLNKIFNSNGNEIGPYDSLLINKDPFLYSEEFIGYQEFLNTKEKIQTILFKGEGDKLTEVEIEQFINNNKNSFLTYYYLGDYMLLIKDYKQAKKFFQIGLTKVIAKKSEQKHMEEGLETAIKKLSNNP